VILVVMVVANVYYTKDFPRFFAKGDRVAGVRELQSYKAPLAWLDAQDSESKVVWVLDGPNLSYFVPILTKDYELYETAGNMHFMSNEEAEERYFLYRSFDNLTKEEMIAERKLYGGPALQYHIENTVNRKVKICRILLPKQMEDSCGSIKTISEIVGDRFFDDLYQRYLLVRKDPKPYLRKYHVNYVLASRAVAQKDRAEQFFGKPVYDNGSFVIYRFSL